jgi:hypothetical protein
VWEIRPIDRSNDVLSPFADNDSCVLRTTSAASLSPPQYQKSSHTGDETISNSFHIPPYFSPWTKNPSPLSPTLLRETHHLHPRANSTSAMDKGIRGERGRDFSLGSVCSRAPPRCSRVGRHPSPPPSIAASLIRSPAVKTSLQTHGNESSGLPSRPPRHRRASSPLPSTAFNRPPAVVAASSPRSSRPRRRRPAGS